MVTPRALGCILALLVELTVQQQPDPLQDFCRRFSQQTCVIDRKLYIDGGFVNYNPLDENTSNYTNTRLLYADLDIINDGMPVEYNNLTKPTNAPDVSGGILWPDTVNKLFYLYGGEFADSPADFSMWMYDALYDTWNQTSADSTQSNIQRAAWGGGVALEDRAIGYYYGGWLSNASVPDWGSQPPVALSTFLQYDILDNKWTNSSGPDSVGRAEGVMVYIPASDRGMLVYFGGVQTASNNGTVVGQNMTEIFLYDIANSKWYTQTATGDVPEERRRFCAGATWADDKSSYNIYLYGGANIEAGVGFDDIYILSIPSFKWIKWYPLAPGEGYPHHSLTCDVVDGAQMIIMGGVFTNSTSCDVPNVYGIHNMDLGKQNPDDTPWYQFRSNLTTYKVPDEIISVVGGSATGGATAKKPADGFSNRDLQNYFSRTYSAATRSPTRDVPTPDEHSGGGTNAGAIAGGVVGGVAGLLLILGALWWWLRTSKKKKQAAAAEQHQQPQEHSQTPTVERKDTGPHELGRQDSPRRSELYGSGLVELPSPDPDEGSIATTAVPPYSPSRSSTANYVPSPVSELPAGLGPRK